MSNAILSLSGEVKVLRFPWGRFLWTRDPGEGLPIEPFSTALSVTHIRDGSAIAEMNLGSGVVTDAGVALMAADWTNSTATLKLINYHDSGTGTSSAAVTDTALGIPTGLARVVGTQSNINNVYSTIAVITYASAANITEWGLLTAPTSGTLFDRRSFGITPIPVVSNDQLRWNYSLTIASGG